MAWIDTGTDEPRWVPDDSETNWSRESYIPGSPGDRAGLLAKGVPAELIDEYESLAASIRAGTSSPQDPYRIQEVWKSIYDVTDPNRGYDSGPWANLAMMGPLALGGLGAAGVLGGAAGTFGAAAPAAGVGGAETASLAAGAGLGDTSMLGSGFMTPAGASLEPLGGAAWQASLGTPLATGAAALPAWATTAGAAGGAASAPAVAGSVGGGAAASAPAGSALSRIIDRTGTTADWTQVLGTAGATGLGMYSANQMSNTLNNLASQNRAERQPFLSAATNYLDPNQWIAGPGANFTQGTLQALSGTHGNPAGSPYSQQLATDAAMRNWMGGVNTLGSLGLGGQGIQANLGAQAAGADADVWSTLAGGVSDVVNPRRSLADLLRDYKTVI